MSKMKESLKAFGSDKKKQKMLLLIGCPILVVIICIGLYFTINTPEPIVPVIEETGSEMIEAPEPYEEKDLFANALSTGEFDETILGETKEAGVSYVTDTLFIGDSNTAGMINHSATTNVSLKNGIGVVSMGISHVKSLHCAKFQGMSAVTMLDAIKIMQPRRIVITFGTNDYYMKPEKFAETYKGVLDAIEEAYPYTDIIIGSIFPITANCSYGTVSMSTIEKFNLELIKLAQEKGVRFLNWSEALKDASSGYCKPEYMAGDGVHLSKKGMEQIFKYFRTHELDTEDKRPKPLKDVPAREPNPPGLLGVGLNNNNNKEKETEVEEVVPNLVTVAFGAGEGGSVSAGSMQVAPGATVGATASAMEGYRFVGWVGAVSSGSPSVSFTVPAGAAPGEYYAISAVFEKIATTEEPPVTDPPTDPPVIDPPVTPDPEPPVTETEST